MTEITQLNFRLGSYDSNGQLAGGVTLFADVTNGLLLTYADFFVN